MNTKEPFLTIRVEGPEIGSGRIPIEHLLTLLGETWKALLRYGQRLQGERESTRRGPKRKNIKQALSLELVEITHGSPATMLHFTPPMKQLELWNQGVISLYEEAFRGLQQAEEEKAPLPHGFDRGVLMAWRDVGLLFEKGVTEITFSINHRDTPLIAKYTATGCEIIQKRIQGPETNILSIEGRLLMADFKEYGTRCRIHPPVGDPVLCLFDEEQKEEVLENILRFVRIVGEAKTDPNSGKIRSLKIHDIKALQEREEEASELLPEGRPLPQAFDFWKSWSIEELAQMQGVQSVNDVSVLLGGWPGDVDDGFEDEIQKLRHSGVDGE